MRPSTLAKLFVVSAFLTAAAPLGAMASSYSTYVSGKGSDAGDCTPAAPCRTLKYALTQTKPDGEVHALDAADFGPVVVARNVRLLGVPGASMSRTTAAPIVEIRYTADIVEISNFVLEGGNKGVATNGIKTSAAGLTVKNCVIRNVKSSGIFVSLPAPGKTILIEDTTVEHTGSTGIYLLTGTATQLVTLNRVTVESAQGDGIIVAQGIAARVNDSMVTHSIGHGIAVVSSPTASLTLSHSALIGNNGYGLFVGAPAVAQSSGDNAFLGNGTGTVSGTLTTLPLL